MLSVSCPGCFKDNFIGTLQLHINNCKSVFNTEDQRVTLTSLDTQDCLDTKGSIDLDSLFEPYATDDAFTDRYGSNNKVLRVNIESPDDDQCHLSYQVLTSQAIYDQWIAEGIIGSPSVMYQNISSNRLIITPFCDHQTFIRLIPK